MQCLCTLRRTTLRRVLQIEENKYTVAINIDNSVILSWCTKHVCIGTCYCPITTVTDTSSCKWQLHKDDIPNRCLCRMDRPRNQQRDSWCWNSWCQKQSTARCIDKFANNCNDFWSNVLDTRPSWSLTGHSYRVYIYVSTQTCHQFCTLFHII